MKGARTSAISVAADYRPDAASSLPRCTCGTYKVMTPDAIGRLRERCPRCDGVAHHVTRHPDDAMLPQGLVRVKALPSIEPGQLRCQGCACGVEPAKRFCDRCSAERSAKHGTLDAPLYKPKACKRCTAVFQPTGPRALYCERCR